MTEIPAKDARLHAAVCSKPIVGTWTDRCQCRHIRVRHKNAEHVAITAGGTTCTGRTHAGECRDCDCATFNPQPEEV